MDDAQHLARILAHIRLGLSEWNECVSWAVDYLLKHEECNDMTIAQLAGSSSADEALELSDDIVTTHLPDYQKDDEFLAGKCILDLHSKYHKNEIDIDELDNIIWKLYVNLDYPNWLVMLSRNCEYATDILEFKKPFEDEFDYIANLWSQSDDLDSFNAQYKRSISDSHDITYQ